MGPRDRRKRRKKQEIQMSRGGPGLQIPGQLRVRCNIQNGPNAHPAATTVPTSDGAQLMVFGGLTKLEYVAGMIAGAMAADNAVATDEAIVEDSVRLAEAVLQECRKRQERAQPDAKDEQEPEGDDRPGRPSPIELPPGAS